MRWGCSRAISQARCSSALARLSGRSSRHRAMNAGAGRSQLLIQAFQASCNASSAKPGSSAQRTGIQRLLGCAIGAGKGAVSSGGSAAGMVSGRAGPGPGGVGVGQAASGPTISAVGTRRGGGGVVWGGAGGGRGGVGVEQAASVPTISAVDTRRRSVDVMGLILLEALLALGLLLAIVWWAMFCGGKGGEPEPPADDDGDRPPAP